MGYIGNSFVNQVSEARVDYFSGNGVTTTFNLSFAPISAFQVHVVVNNVPQNPATAYSIVNNQIIFDGAPSAGVNNIYVRYNGGASQTVAIGQGTVPSGALAGANAPTWDSFGNFTVNGSLRNLITENIRTTSYTLQLSDQGLAVTMNNTSAATVTVPPNSSVAFPIGAVLFICRIGSGTTTLAAGAGVTLSKAGNLGLNEQLALRKRDTDSWIVIDTPASPSASGGSQTLVSGSRISTFATDGTFTVA